METWRVKDDCRVCLSFSEGTHCRQEVDKASPQVLSEQLCIMSLERVLERHEGSAATDNMRHAWTLLEASLASAHTHPLFNRYANDKLSEAFHTVNEIITDKTGNLVETFEAVSLKNFEGFFRARINQDPITPQLMRQTRDDIGALICAIDETDDRPPEYQGYVSGFMAEQIVSWLLLYSADPANAPYPTSDREAKNNFNRLNHDRYLLRDEQKIPLEIKRRHRHVKDKNKPKYDKPIIKLVLQDILDRTASALGRKETRNRRDNFLIDYIRFDLSGRESPAKEKVIRTASNITLKIVDQGIAENRRVAEKAQQEELVSAAS